ncbi:MAG: RsmB/NOP family class I SAM-dependent RNA methyltransferase [Candidatus Pacebacteria bacterium]|nr:RsmB/NOP family class I SAM-dependent RNA methyltransferase [Candidatus Paceibacterota bacterium]
MIPAARIQATIEILEEVASGGPADGVASGYFRGRRYIGSSDRSTIAESVYAILRRRARLDWWINLVLERSPDSPPPPPRHRMIANLILDENWSEARFTTEFNGDSYRPAALSRAERQLLLNLSGQSLDDSRQPEWVQSEMPDWFLQRFKSQYPEADATARASLNHPAAMDLRVNRLRGDRERALAEIKAIGVSAAATELSPLGIRVGGRPALARYPLFQSGLVEIQDEGSQLIALLTEAVGGMKLLDYCAGAGGKTLALAAEMGNRGRIIASDISAKRLDRASQRLKRAGVHNVELRALTADNAKWFKRQASSFDRVLVDAPCSGSGTWRRNPDMKWKFSPVEIAELRQRQGDILRDAARFVKPGGGRLIYSTCSLLPEENDQIIEAFLVEHPGAFRQVSVASIWPRAVATAMPSGVGMSMQLSPHLHGTDGFFCAVLERCGDAIVV